MIYQTVNFYDFEKAFRDANRLNQFTSTGLEHLFEHLEELADSEDIELDVIALCCEYTEGATDVVDVDLDTVFVVAKYEHNGMDMVLYYE